MSNAPSTLSEAIATIEAKNAMIARLNEQLEWLKRQAFGQKSEKIIAAENAIDAFAGEDTNEAVQAPREVAAHTRNIKGHGRNELPENLPVETVIVDVPDAQKTCPDCGAEMCECGHETSRRLCRRTEYFIRETKRIKRACKLHPEAGVVIADVPPSYIPKGIADEHVIARTITDKHLDHLPLDRQERRFSRDEIMITKSTMVDWHEKVAGDLELIVALMKKMMLGQNILYSDDTKIPVVGDEKGKTKRGYFWIWSDGRRWVVFDYSGTRGQSAPENFMGDWKGFLHSDAYCGYEASHAKGVTPVFCWAHARRKFFDAFKAGNKLAQRPLSLIGRMFAVDRIVSRSESMSLVEKHILRNRISACCEQALWQWCSRNETMILPASKLGEALKYYRNQRNGLRTFLRDPRLCLDNNLSERNLRAVVIGRKNRLFAGSDEGAKRAAIFYSIIATCKLQGIDAEDYLVKFMQKKASDPDCSVENLLPGTL
jgi:transposase